MLIAQISDFHITAPGTLYQGIIPTEVMAEAAVAHVNNLDPAPDLVLFTGDLVESGLTEEYDAARNVLEKLDAPYAVLPGNHDDRENFRAAFRDHAYLPRNGPLHFCLNDAPVRVIGLDCSVPNQHYGALDLDGFTWLETCLRADPEKPTVLATHHHPVASGVPYLDAYANRSGPKIEGLLREFDNIIRILFGHVHRLMMAPFAGSLAVSCPSTASQIALRTHENAAPASFMEPPGILLHVLRPGGSSLSHFSPIGDFGPAMDFF
ncbi:phosphodiesterase [Roseobacter weihaiensis]|uniref:phosphodiesterase n=1 Tax=Roseobacter weihaiensis TaxID=2763262 RepID=UPI001D0A8391|nr:phosphodiesterase [Roseobacter sp. H9]